MHDNKQKKIVPNTDGLEGGGYSFPIMTILLVYGGLLMLIARVPLLWGRITLHIVYLLLISYFLRSAFSDTDFQKAKKTEKALSPGTWKLNNLLFFVLIPFGVWICLMTMRGWRF